MVTDLEVDEIDQKLNEVLEISQQDPVNINENISPLHFNKNSMNNNIIELYDPRKGSKNRKFWYEGELHEELCKRRKGQHLNSRKKTYIMELLKCFPKNHKSRRKAYKISTSTCNKLKKMWEPLSNSEALINNESPERKSISGDAQNFITKFLRPPQPHWTIQKLRKAVSSELGEIYSAYILRKYIKSKLRYSFKKAWSRPPKYAESTTKISKGWFWAELLRIINKEQLIFSADEWSFTRMVIAEYSWLPIGKSSSVINDIWKGSASLILSVGSNGQWFGLIKQGTIDSKIFWIFLKLFEKVVLESCSASRNTPSIILDNARIHTSHFTKSLINQLNLRV